MNIQKISSYNSKSINFSSENSMDKFVKKEEPKEYDRIKNNAAEIKQKREYINSTGLDKRDLVLASIITDLDFSNPSVAQAWNKARSELTQGLPVKQTIINLKKLIPSKAAYKETPLGPSIMAEGWDKPIIFPKDGGFTWVGWADEPEKISTEDLWNEAYGYTPALIMGAVGNSNIKPEQVKGGCSLSKKELSALYEKSIENFYQPIFNYLKENGANPTDIGFAFAHSDCGVDRAARNIVEQNKLMGFATTPTEYTQYIRGTEYPANEDFPNGYIIADFPFPSVLTRNQHTQIKDYAEIYGKIVGKENPLGVFGGGEHAFVRDAKEALIGNGGAIAVPVDIMKDEHKIEIPATNEKGAVINASRNMLNKIDGNPYEQFMYTFKYHLPNSKSKSDLTHDGMKSIATIAYTRLNEAGKIK